MTDLIYTIADGLVEVESLDDQPGLDSGGTYVRGRPYARENGVFTLPMGWYRRVQVTDTLGDPYWHWEKTNKNELPKRLKAWALIMGIEL